MLLPLKCVMIDPVINAQTLKIDILFIFELFLNTCVICHFDFFLFFGLLLQDESSWMIVKSLEYISLF